MKRDQLSDQQCSVARSSAVLGDPWTLTLLSDCFLGVRRFEEFQERLKVSRTTLTSRLKRLEEHGILVQCQYEQRPPRFEYRLTQKGKDLFPVVSTLLAWGDKYYWEDATPPIIRTHKHCGHDFQAYTACSECGEPLELKDVEARTRPDNDRYPPVERGPFKRGS